MFSICVVTCDYNWNLIKYEQSLRVCSSQRNKGRWMSKARMVSRKKTYEFKQGFSDVQAGLYPRFLIGNRCWFTKKTREGEVSQWKQRYELGCISKSDEQETMKTKREELMEICNGGRDGAAAAINKDVNAKAVRKHRKVKEWPGNIETQEAICVDSLSKRGKNAVDQSEDVKYSDAAKQDELMETCNAAEMVVLM